MNTVNDKQIMDTLLFTHKLGASALNNLVLESADESLRNDTVSVLSRMFQRQKQVFDLMTQKGWYTTEAATQQELTKARQMATPIVKNQ